MGLLDGRVAIITGASKGIGRALSLRFAREGARVVCAARSADLVKDTAAQVQKAGGQAIAVVCDAAVEDEVRRLVATSETHVTDGLELRPRSEGVTTARVEADPSERRLR